MNKEKIIAKLSEMNFLSENNLRYGDNFNGKTYAEVFKNESRYVPEAKCWYIYDGKKWIPDKGCLQVQKNAKDLTEAIGEYAYTVILPKEENEAKRKEIVKYVSSWQSLKTRNNLLKDAESEYPISKEDFDSNVDLFNISNGTLNFRTGELLPHNPNDLITMYSEVLWDENANYDRWDLFISEVCNDNRELAVFLQKAMGYSASGDTSQECAFFLYGATTRNGKSTLVDAIGNVLGDYSTVVNAETVMQPKFAQNGNTHSEDIARLAGIRFAHVPEPAKSVVLNVARIKSITGNDPITARFLYSSSFTFKPQFKIVVNTNYLPQVNDITLFKGDRIRVIPFSRHFSEEERDKDLKSKFASNEAKSRILKWLVEGYQLMLTKGFESPQIVKEATNQYEKESDKIKMFKEDCLIYNEGSIVRYMTIYELYKDWCEYNGYKAENQRNFKSMLLTIPDLGIDKTYDGVTHTTCVFDYDYTKENLG